MGVGLYTSRVVLDTLGVEDYGVYSVVGGVVSLFSLFHMAMSTATQRYLSFEIGSNNFDQLKKTFNAVLNIHIGIAILVLIFAETIGLWFVNNKLNVPANRMDAVHWVYQFSIFSMMLGIISVPFNSLIIAREKMNVYAYVSVLEVILKLLVLYVLVIFSFDKLKLYAVLLFLVTIIMVLIRYIYCRVKYRESKYNFYFDKKLYKELLSFTGWSLFGNAAGIAQGQGSNILLNLFFGTVINAAYGITLQVSGAVRSFVGNFQMALNPQIIKTYAAGNNDQSLKLIFQGSKFSFFVMFLIASPVIYNIDYILKLWLNTPPKYTSIFVTLSLINALTDTISRPLMIGAQASGKIKWYQITIGSVMFLTLPISYILLRLFKMPEIVFLVIIFMSIISLFLRLFFLKKLIRLNINLFIKNVLFKITYTTAIPVMIMYIICKVIYLEAPFSLFLIKSLIITVLNIFAISTIGLTSNERNFILSLIKQKIK